MNNNNNKLELKEGGFGRVLTLKEKDSNGSNLVVFLPVSSKVANARILEVHESGAISVHWKENFNDEGDFQSEVMLFDENLVLDNSDLDKRNEFRVRKGLMPIK